MNNEQFRGRGSGIRNGLSFRAPAWDAQCKKRGRILGNAYLSHGISIFFGLVRDFVIPNRFDPHHHPDRIYNCVPTLIVHN